MDANIITQISTDPTLKPFLPFFFVLAIVFGLLSIANIFKNRQTGRTLNSVNLMIALVFAFFAAGYQTFVDLFFANFSIILWAFVILFFIAFALHALGLRGKDNITKGREDLPITLLGIVLLLLVTSGFAYISEIEIPILGTENFMILLALILIALMFFYAYELGRNKPAGQYQK